MRTEFKNCKVLPLLTKDPTRLVKREHANNKYTYILFDELEMYDETTFRNQHLYICSDCNIKNGEFLIISPFDDSRINYLHEVIVVEDNQIYCKGGIKFSKLHYVWSKVIATTDESLGLPGIPQQFLKEFCEKNGIWEVGVEYEKVKNEVFISVGEAPFFQPKFTNNTINIKCSKQTWTKEEVIALCESSYNVGWHIGYDTHSGDSYDSREVFNDWVNQNIL